MAKAARKTTTPRPKRVRKPKIVDTRESLIAEMGDLLDRVQSILPGFPVIQWRWGNGPLSKERVEREAIVDRMRILIDDMVEEQSADEIFAAALARPGGTVPSLAFPGSWVEWVGYVPVLVTWCGFLDLQGSLSMVDPTEKWLNARGYQGLHLYPARGDANLRKMIRDELIDATRNKKFTIFEVDADAKEEAAKALAENEWLRKALAAGPVDPIPMPPKLRAVQTMPFA
jgi:hypothetical protein